MILSKHKTKISIFDLFNRTFIFYAPIRFTSVTWNDFVNFLFFFTLIGN